MKPTVLLLSLYATGAFAATNVFANENVNQTANDEIEKVEVVGVKQAYRGNVPLFQTPQAVNQVSDEFLESLGVNDFQSALSFTSSIVSQNSFGGLWDSFAIRGFAGDENLPSGYLINGFNAGRGFSGRRNTVNVETIEILKGPGSALFGRSEPGGTVNIITKKPQFEQEGFVALTLGSYNEKELVADYTNALSDNIAFRINGSYEDSESFRDTVNFESTAINPSVLWRLNDATTVTYELELLDQKSDFDRGVFVLDNKFYDVDIEAFYGETADGPMEVEATGHQLVVQHDLNENWSVLAGFGLRESSFEGLSSDTELSGGRQLIYVDGETLSRQRRYRDYDAKDASARFELSGDLATGNLVHHLLVGFDAYDYELESVQNRWRVGWGSGDDTYAINVNDRVYNQSQPEMSPQNDRLEEQESVAVYFQDQIDINEHWKVSLGLRVDDFKQTITNNLSGAVTSQDQTATSPRLGVVYQANANVVAYASVSEGFRPNSGMDTAGNAFEPEESSSHELGLKWQSDDQTVGGNLAIFRAEKSNILTADLINGGSVALGEAVSKGLELDLNTQVTENTDLNLSYTYVDAATSNDMVNVDWGVEIPAGSRLINIAKNMANLTLRHFYQLQDKDAEIGVNVTYVGDRLGETIDPEYILPSYTTTRLFGAVAIQNNLSLRFDIENLFNEKYFASSYHKLWTMPGAPRQYSVTLSYDF